MDIFGIPYFWALVGGGGVVGGVAAVMTYLHHMVQVFYRDAQRKQEDLERMLREIRVLAKKVAELARHVETRADPEEARVLRALKESLENLPRYRDPEARYQEEAFLQVAVSLALEVLRHHVEALPEGEAREDLARLWTAWQRLDVEVDAVETGYNHAARRYNRWIQTFPVNLLAFWVGMKPLPLFVLAGDVEGALTRAYRRVREGKDAEGAGGHASGEKRPWDSF